MTRTAVAIAVLFVSTVVAAVPARAQYFGRNKVQYGRFDFQVLETPHFDVYYYPAEKDAAAIASIMAERWYEKLSTMLEHTFASRQPIILYASHSHFVQTSVIPGSIGEGVGGFTDHFAGRVVLPFAGGLGDTDHVLGHEIVHAFQRDILRSHGHSLSQLPLWFSEGMAEELSVGALDANTQMWLRDAAESGRLPTIAQLDDPRYFPYRYGQALWHFLADRYGPAAIERALTSRGSSAAVRLSFATGTSTSELSAQWHEAVRAMSARVPARGLPGTATRLIAAEHGGRVNVGPRISPDGRYVVFLSERDGYSVDVFLADARSGAILRKLVSAASDPHYDSLQFIDSAGAWDAASRRFALASVRDGSSVISIFDTADDSRQDVEVAAVDQIFSPSWSPDGRRIAFSAMKGGVTDLYALTLSSTSDVQALTDDPFSDLQPAWSPDGTRIAFSTDRFSSSLDTLTFGRHELAVLDLQTGKIDRITSGGGAKAIDPQWSADGAALYYVSDEGDVSNVHRVDVASRQARQVTAVSTGVSGITALSPSISLGGDGRQLALSVYSHGAYEVWTMDVSEIEQAGRSPEAAGEPVSARAPATFAPPSSPLTSSALALSALDASRPADRRATPSPAPAATYPLFQPPALRDAASSPRPVARIFESRDYVPRLTLVRFGTPYLSAGGGAFGTFLRAGMSMALSDMLGQQEVGVAFQVGKTKTDNAVVAAYANRQSRLNWSLTGGWIPALVGASNRLTAGADAVGANMLVREQTLVQQVHRQFGGAASYPFSRAQRVEASVLVDDMTFDRRSTISTYSASTRRQLGGPETRITQAPGALTIQTGVALVYDSSIFGPTGPVFGRRYRFSVTPTFGDLSLLTSAADYRRYFNAGRVWSGRDATLALRLQGAARTGRDSADARLLPLVWNMRDLVRGVDTDADTIRTTRFALANLELRVPLVGPQSAGSALLPIDGIAFAECGRFSYPGAGASGADSRGLCSVGAGARVNAAGFVFEFHAARPIGAPARNGWRFGVAFRPGF
ncbi:MAG: PD40 domain-containing protein [Acidobacteria bacterium]|nr:PD40 domain-containing protein [Acidobacteriota bacterium]